MHAERTESELRVLLTEEEVFRLQNGKPAGERFGLTQTDAKIWVRPLSEVEIDDSAERYGFRDEELAQLRKATAKANMALDGDLQVFVPGAMLVDTRNDRVKVSRNSIEIPGIPPEDRELLLQNIPERGIVVHLGGSLKTVDVMEFFET